MPTPTSGRVAQHTPGPWRVGDAGATVFGPPQGLPPLRIASGCRKADARLIAAAPDLLAALSNILAYHDAGRTETRWTEKDGIAEAGSLVNMDLARDIIRRATEGA